MRIAVVGAGIAGTTLAYWLRRTGHLPTLIEKAPRLRTGGYVIDFWGPGYAVAEKMGLRPQLESAGYAVREVRIVDGHGTKVGGFGVDGLRRFADGRFTSLPRGDLARLIYGAIEGDVETIFGDTVTGIVELADGMRVVLQSGAERTFDLVVGAGGLHSPVRRLAFGPEARFAKNLGYWVAAFASGGYRPRDELVYVAHGMPGRMVGRFALRGDATMFLLIFTADHLNGAEPRGLDAVKGALWNVFGDAGWESAAVLQSLEQADDIYFDNVSQIVMDRWSRGRVMLIGDAAAAVSLLAGEGAGLAMTQAYVLAGELNRAGDDHRVAYARYERLLRPLVEQKQKDARRFAAAFAPTTAAGVWVRNQATKILAIPHVGDRLLSRQLSDDFALPAYGI
jgi:2-polyprenyl-6-methoxyphenol hydroxylase-like FAD-dependent oxidoreductase